MDYACSRAIDTAERRLGVPAGLLRAIGVVESGRLLPGKRAPEPWPWTVNVADQGHYFAAPLEAIALVQRMRVDGVQSIDVGCMQVNLLYHPNAFPSLEAAFDPVINVNYAAAFLLRLYHQTGDWMTAVGHYHSETAAIAESYRRRVDGVYRGSTSVRCLAQQAALQRAWAATLPARDQVRNWGSGAVSYGHRASGDGVPSLRWSVEPLHGKPCKGACDLFATTRQPCD